MNSTYHHSVPNTSGLHELPSEIIGETLSFEYPNKDSSTYQCDTVKIFSSSTNSFYSDIFELIDTKYDQSCNVSIPSSSLSCDNSYVSTSSLQYESCDDISCSSYHGDYTQDMTHLVNLIDTKQNDLDNEIDNQRKSIDKILKWIDTVSNKPSTIVTSNNHSYDTSIINDNKM